MSSALKKVLVTGGNRGIGLALCQRLAASGFQVLVGSRKLESAKSAVGTFPTDSVDFVQIDISDKESIKDCVEAVKEKHGFIDVLINNAGIADDNTMTAEIVETTFATNYFGTRNFTEAMLPIVRERIINMSSAIIRLAHIPNVETRQRLLDATSVEELDGIFEEFRTAVASGSALKGQWPNSAYGMSKLGIAMWTRVAAMGGAYGGVFLASIHPGFVSTELTLGRGVRDVFEGTNVPFAVSTMDISDATKTPTGRLWVPVKDSDTDEIIGTEAMSWLNAKPVRHFC